MLPSRIPFSPPASFALPDVAMSDLAVFTVNGRHGMPRTLLLCVSQEFLDPVFRPHFRLAPKGPVSYFERDRDN